MYFEKSNLEKKLMPIKYSFSFVSLISPYIINNLKFLTFDRNNDDERKVFVKQSYMLLTWFFYLSISVNKDNEKKRLRISILPKKRKIFTLTKAPIAHKNWSKEQYKFQYFQFKISFKSFLKDDNFVNCLNSASLFIFLAKKNIFSFETNVFFLKNFNIFFFFNDCRFFNYNRFIKLL